MTAAAAPKFTYADRIGHAIATQTFTPLPDPILDFRAEVGLTIQEFYLYADVMRFKWTAALPAPALGELARRSGVSERTIQRLKRSLVQKGLLILIPRTCQTTSRQLPDAWDFTPLHDRAHALSQISRPNFRFTRASRVSPGEGDTVMSPLYDRSRTSSKELVKREEVTREQQPQTPSPDLVPPADGVVAFLNFSTGEDPEISVESEIDQEEHQEQATLPELEETQTAETTEREQDRAEKDLNNSPPAPRMDELTTAEKDARKAVIAHMVELNVTEFAARQLVRLFPVAYIETQIAALPYRKPRDMAAALVASIRQGWQLPPVLLQLQAEQAKKAAADDAKRRQVIDEVLANIRDRQRPLQDRARSAAETFAEAQRQLRRKVYTDAEMLELIAKHYDRLQALDAQQIEEDRKALARFGLTLEAIAQTLE